MTLTQKRRAKFDSFKDHPWHGKHFKKLTKKDMEFVDQWFAKNGEVDHNQWEHKCNMMWVDCGSDKKPKNGMIIMELLCSCREGV